MVIREIERSVIVIVLNLEAGKKQEKASFTTTPREV
jgi:hypothetical protein